MDPDPLKKEYDREFSRIEAFCRVLGEELAAALKKYSVALAVPLEARAKDWPSIAEKTQRMADEISTIWDMGDLLGARVIVLFRRDLSKGREAIADYFDIIQDDDTAKRLDETQFGYQSRHLDVKMPDRWRGVAGREEFVGLHAEIQLRTLAQHLWAVASTELQYKHEDDVPRPLRRRIYGTAAVLEMIDMEFDRILDARATYVAQADLETADEPLNVDLLEKYLDSVLPPKNKDVDEPYAELLAVLFSDGVRTLADLRALVNDGLADALRLEEKSVRDIADGRPGYICDPARQLDGVFFTHDALVVTMLRLKRGTLRREEIDQE